MDNLWKRLEDFLQQNAPRIYAGLAPGATEDQITAVEQSIGFHFPADVRRSYLRHDGQTGDYGMPQGGTFLPDCFVLLPLEKVLSKWQDNIALLEDIQDDMPDGDGAGPGVKSVFLDPAWVPVAKERVGANQICLDFDPAPNGSIGQIVAFDHEADGQQCLAADFKTWLTTIVCDLEAGRLVWDAEGECYDFRKDNGRTQPTRPDAL